MENISETVICWSFDNFSFNIFHHLRVPHMPIACTLYKQRSLFEALQMLVVYKFRNFFSHCSCIVSLFSLRSVKSIYATDHNSVYVSQTQTSTNTNEEQIHYSVWYGLYLFVSVVIVVELVEAISLLLLNKIFACAQARFHF